MKKKVKMKKKEQIKKKEKEKGPNKSSSAKLKQWFGGMAPTGELFFAPRASFTLHCRPPTPLVVGSECGTTPPSQL